MFNSQPPLPETCRERSWGDDGPHRLVWVKEGAEYIVECQVPLGELPIVGFGATRAAALADLDQAYRALFDFAHESDQEWWHALHG